MVFGNHQLSDQEMKYGSCQLECTCGYHWKLGTQLIKQVNSYKYLGIELDSKLSLREFKTRIGEKARKNVSKVWSMGMKNGCLSVKAGINLYQALIRSVLEYGCEIWGDEEWEQGERIQREMGRRILRCSGKTTNEAVLGELGWWKLRTRREYCKLKYWIRILLMNNTRLVKKVYNKSKEKYIRTGTNNWCKIIHRLAIKYDLEAVWEDEKVIQQPPDEKKEESEITPRRLKQRWTSYLYQKVQMIEEAAWLRQMNKKPKLRTYCTFKHKLELESYLKSETQKSAKFLLTRIRTGTSELRIETGRWKRPQEKVEERRCRACMTGEAEDEKHFILDCKTYQIMREEMFERIKSKTTNMYDMKVCNREERWQILMNPNNMKTEINEVVKEYIKKAIKRRNQI